MPLASIRPSDGGTRTIVANKCSIIRNAPCRMNMHPPWHPTSAPFFFPDLSSTATARSSFPAVSHMSHYADSSGGARARTGFNVAGAAAITPSAWIQSVSKAAFHWSLARTVVWLGWWRGRRRWKVKTTVVFISSVQGTR
jgi:hypothetical protein